MNIALVHELLTMKGGAEKVLRILANMFPDAPIYTLLYDEKKLGDWFPKQRVRTSKLQRFAGLSTNHHLYLPFFPGAVEAWDLSEFDLVISSSSAFVHGIITNGKPKHLCYVHSPARYLWDRTHDVLNRAKKRPFGFIRAAKLSQVFHRLRVWDSESSERPDVLLAASAEIQRRVELYWRRKSDIVHPPIDSFWIESTQDQPTKNQDQPYYLIVSTLAAYKRIELAIEACNKLKKRLVIAGDGPHREALERIAGPTVEWTGYVDEDTLKNLYTDAQATLFPGDEDFGLVPLESMSCGTPVVAYRGGGALETVIEGMTGEFFDEPTADALAKTLETFEHKKYAASDCQMRAWEFSRTNFEKLIHGHIDTLMKTD